MTAPRRRTVKEWDAYAEGWWTGFYNGAICGVFVVGIGTLAVSWVLWGLR